MLSAEFPSTGNVKGRQIVLTFNEDLRTLPLQLSSVFTVTVGGSSHTVNSVVKTGARILNVTFDAPAALPEDMVTVTYTPPATNPLEDAAGNDVAVFTTGQSGVPAVVNNLVATEPTTPLPTDTTTPMEFSAPIIESVTRLAIGEAKVLWGPAGGEDTGYELFLKYRGELQLLDDITMPNITTVILDKDAPGNDDVLYFRGVLLRGRICPADGRPGAEPPLGGGVRLETQPRFSPSYGCAGPAAIVVLQQWQ